MILKFSLFAGAIWFWYRGMLTIADFVFVLSSYLVFTGYFRPIGDRIRDLQEAMSDIEDVVRFQKTPIEVADASAAKALEVIRGKIELKRVNFHYPVHHDHIFENFSLTIQAGEKVALVGHSGSGKSTLVRLIQRLYNVQKGGIYIDDQDIAAVTQESLRKHIALVPQDPVLFHRSLRENIAYGKPAASLKEIERAAKLAYASQFIESLPQHYETLVGERGVKLSGGERQRVAIARAILSECPIVILDEATSSLDSHSESLIQEALKNLLKNRTSIIIAHRLSTIKSADRILVFAGGKIVEEGTHSHLVRKEGGVYKKLYEMQVGGFLSDEDEMTGPSIEQVIVPIPEIPVPESGTAEPQTGV
jgi:ATP-binding cassette subfamily B protein